MEGGKEVADLRVQSCPCQGQEEHPCQGEGTGLQRDGKDFLPG